MTKKEAPVTIKVGVPPYIEVSFKLSYQQIEKIGSKVKKMGSFFSGKKTEELEKDFKNALLSAKHGIEASIWDGKGFAIQGNCGSKVDEEFHHLFAFVISIFNEIHMRFDPTKVSEDLKEHLKRRRSTNALSHSIL